MRKYVNQAVMGILSLLFLSVISVLPVHAASASVSVGGGGSVQEGDVISVTLNVSGSEAISSVTIGLSYDPGVLEFLKDSRRSDINGGNGIINIAGNSVSYTLNFKAAGQGSTNVSVVDCYVGPSNPDSGDYMDVSGIGAGAAVSVTAPQANPGGSTGGNAGISAGSAGGQTGTGSDDCTLQSLQISPGTLSPAFSPNIYQYTSQVDADVTKITVSAIPTDAKATVTSVNGTGLDMGENTTTIVVQSESGKRATYTLHVTRGKAEDAADSEAVVNGKSYNIEDIIPDRLIPEGFEEATTDYRGKQVKALLFPKGKLAVVYLTEKENTENSALYVYDAASNSFYPFIMLQGLNGKFIILMVPGMEVAIPEGYSQGSVKIGDFDFIAFQRGTPGGETSGNNGKNIQKGDALAEGQKGQEVSKSWLSQALAFLTEPLTVQATEPQEGQQEGAQEQQQETQQEAPSTAYTEVKGTDFYLLYGINSDGSIGWYQYDALEGTYQRYLAPVTTVKETDVPQEGEELLALKNQLAAANKKYEEDITMLRRILYVGLGVIVLLVVFVIVTIVRNKRVVLSGMGLDAYDEDEDEDEEEDFYYDEDDDEEEEESALISRTTQADREERYQRMQRGKAVADREERTVERPGNSMSGVSFYDDGDEEDDDEDEEEAPPRRQRVGNLKLRKPGKARKQPEEDDDMEIIDLGDD